ncbi:hypothetical protein KVR01_001359 [Diaporthe batatas]|uniref:uncharacterized protein n=1 Tax=Diaporthe batatas TaxID=748121 RepID=UPI001D05A943|nr:uncharacterized protein KVR01_001359 [Diaporthe batatas]KAG8168610.1 hypothetical protein KVR01_001359 [Diaporthe batatas]
MHPVQKLSPSHSQSSAGRSTLADDDDVVTSATSYDMHRQRPQQPSEKRRSPRFIVAVLGLLVFIAEFGASLSDVPSVRLLQEIICRRELGLAPDSPVEEGKCHTDAVQGQLNVVSMGGLVFGYLPGILVALPYGSLADRRGRKPVLGLCIWGMILSQLIWIAAAWNHPRWDLRNVWFSALPLLIGGGATVAEAMVFAIIADVAPEGKTATYFQFEICAVLLAEAVAPFVASAMMTYSVWTPILVSPAVMALGGTLICLIPETLHTKPSSPSNTRRKVTPAVPKPLTFTDRVHKYAPEAKPAPPPSTYARLRDSLASTARLLKSRDALALTPGATLATPVVTVTMGITLRYMPLRFGWTLAQTGMVLGVRTGLNILVLLVFLPVVSNSLLSTQDGRGRDMVLARASALLLAAGEAVFACAPEVGAACAGLAVLTLGSGLPSLCRAVLARLVGRGQGGRLFGLLAVFEMLGFLCCGVGFGAVFQAGLGHGLAPGADGDGGGLIVGGTVLRGREAWLALVFYVAAGIYVVCAGLLWIVRKGVDGRGGDIGDAASISSAASSASLLHEARILADGRFTRKHPSLENVAVAV